MNSMAEVKSFYDEDTSTLTHIVYDKNYKDAVIIDPIMDFNLQTFCTSSQSVDKVLEFCKAEQLKVSYILETHSHADHISGSQLVKKAFPKAKVSIGKEVTQVQKYFSEFYDLPQFPCDGSQFDHLYSNASEIDVGSFSVKTWHTPGHTPACYTLQIEDKLFTGDAIFAPDLGTGRCDFPGGSARTLYHSIKNVIYSKADTSTMYFGHDYPDKRSVMEHVKLEVQKNSNLRLNMQTTEEDFIKFRSQRDKELKPPRLFLPSLFFNISAAKIPDERKNGRSYICFPLNAL